MKFRMKFLPFGVIPSVNYSNNQVALQCCNGCNRLDSHSSGGVVVPGYYIGSTSKSDLTAETPLVMETDDNSCRELLFHSLVRMTYYIRECQELTMRGLPQPNPENLGHIEAICNSIWMGLTESNMRFSYTTSSASVANLPLDLVANGGDAGGPLFSIFSHWLKYGNNTFQRSNIVPTMNVFRQRVDPILGSTEPLNKTDRKSLIRSVVDLYWNGMGGSAGDDDYYWWAKYMTLWSALGGMSFINPAHGFGYLSVTKRRFDEHFYCSHHSETGARPNASYNGARSFYSAYFNRVIDGRSVARFVGGGRGMIMASALTYLAPGRPWTTTTSS